MRVEKAKKQTVDEKVAAYKAKLEAEAKAKAEKDNAPFWDKQEIVAVIPKSEKMNLKISLCKKDGATFVDIRNFIMTKEGEKPTIKGTSIPVTKQEDLTPVISALQRAGSLLRKMA